MVVLTVTFITANSRYYTLQHNHKHSDPKISLPRGHLRVVVMKCTLLKGNFIHSKEREKCGYVSPGKINPI